MCDFMKIFRLNDILPGRFKIMHEGLIMKETGTCFRSFIQINDFHGIVRLTSC